MKTRNTITKLIAITMAVAAMASAGLLCGAGWLQPVKAQSGKGTVRFISYVSIGISPRHRLRLSVANPAHPRRESGGLIYSGEISYASGLCPGPCPGDPPIKILRSRVDWGGFGHSDVLYGDFGVDGEPRTGRVQMLVKILIEAPSGSEPADFPVSLEVINEETGATSTIEDIKFRVTFGAP